MLLKDTPSSFHRIILAMIRRIISQHDFYFISCRKFYDPFRELGSLTTILWTIICVDNERIYTVLKVLFEPIGFNGANHKVCCHLCLRKYEFKMTIRYIQYPIGGQKLIAEIMINCLYVHPALPTPGKGPDFPPVFRIDCRTTLFLPWYSSCTFFRFSKMSSVSFIFFKGSVFFTFLSG